jgi:ligand-binding SRPBCC domain-containing protein
MTTYSRKTRIHAPFEDVWSFHATLDGLEALTPDFMNLMVRSVTGPDGDPNPEEMVAGTRIDLAIQPFGVGPRQEWTTVITDRSKGDSTGWFRDVMEGGPFPTWEHTHRFVAHGKDTIISDHVEYVLPGGTLARTVSPLGWLCFEPMFRARHRKTKELLE